MFENLRNKRIIITRLTTVSGYRKAYATLTATYVEIQPAVFDKNNNFDGSMSKQFRCYADISEDILEGDKLREVSTGRIFKVRTGGSTIRTQGSIEYLQLLVEHINE